MNSSLELNSFRSPQPILDEHRTVLIHEEDNPAPESEPRGERSTLNLSSYESNFMGWDTLLPCLNYTENISFNNIAQECRRSRWLKMLPLIIIAFIMIMLLSLTLTASDKGRSNDHKDDLEEQSGHTAANSSTNLGVPNTTELDQNATESSDRKNDLEEQSGHTAANSSTNLGVPSTTEPDQNTIESDDSNAIQQVRPIAPLSMADLAGILALVPIAPVSMVDLTGVSGLTPGIYQHNVMIDYKGHQIRISYGSRWCAWELQYDGIARDETMGKVAEVSGFKSTTDVITHAIEELLKKY